MFNLHKFDCKAHELGSYNEEIVRVFYAFYVNTLRGSLDMGGKIFQTGFSHLYTSPGS